MSEEYSNLRRRRRDYHSTSTTYSNPSHTYMTDGDFEDENYDELSTSSRTGTGGPTGSSSMSMPITLPTTAFDRMVTEVGLPKTDGVSYTATDVPGVATTDQSGRTYSTKFPEAPTMPTDWSALVIGLSLATLAVFILIFALVLYLFTRGRRSKQKRNPKDVHDMELKLKKTTQDIGGQPGTNMNAYTPSRPGSVGENVNRSGKNPATPETRYEEVNDIPSSTNNGPSSRSQPMTPLSDSRGNNGGYEEEPVRGSIHHTLEPDSPTVLTLQPSEANGGYDELARGGGERPNDAGVTGQYDTTTDPSQQNGGYDTLERGRRYGQGKDDVSTGQYDKTVGHSKGNGEYDQVDRRGGERLKGAPIGKGQYDTALSNPRRNPGEYDKLRQIDVGRPGETVAGQYDKLRPKPHVTSYDKLTREGEENGSASPEPLSVGGRNEYSKAAVSAPSEGLYESPDVIGDREP